MDNVSVHNNTVGPTARHTGKGTQAGKPKNNRKKLIALGASLAALIILGLGSWFLYQSSTAATIDSGKYQAVFFTNGQVYFGKLHTLNNNYMKLTDIFYLQTQNASTDSKNPQQTTAQQSNDVQLVKLGSEVHGPDDEMIISKDQVLFFENLKKDGKVADSISKYLSQKK